MKNDQLFVKFIRNSSSDRTNLKKKEVERFILTNIKSMIKIV